MTYNNYHPNAGLGVPGAGFASRGKANGIKRLNLASPPALGALDENQVEETPAPRTSRSYLLAGLRTAPKTPSAMPSTAPYNQTEFNGMDNSRYAYNNSGHNMNHGQQPHTAIGSSFPGQYGMTAGQQFYTLPEQVLAPPNLDPAEVDEDPQYLAHLQATKSMLAMRQQLLQQQLANLSVQQFAAMNLGGAQMQQFYNSPQTPLTPQMGMYQQQLLANMQPVVQEVPGQPGIYSVYNPLTGQTTFAADNSMREQQLANSPPPPTPGHNAGFHMENPNRRNMSPHHEMQSPYQNSRSISPPKKTPSPQTDVEPLPPPSANAFRRGHNKNVSSLSLANTKLPMVEGPKSAYILRNSGIPPTPLTGTFGPGQARAGEHPIRQPRGPPAIDELKAKPTTKFEGSKNFVARQRRQALSNLVKAGLGRRVRPGSGSAGSMTPVSESELTFSIPSDNDSDSGHSAHGAIGSERKSSREQLRGDALEDAAVSEAKKTRVPLLALANAASKRNSAVY